MLPFYNCLTRQPTVLLRFSSSQPSPVPAELKAWVPIAATPTIGPVDKLFDLSTVLFTIPNFKT